MRPVFSASVIRVACAMFAATTIASAVHAQGSVTIRRPGPADTSGRDSVVRVIITVSPEGIAKMIDDLLTSRQMEERIAMAMREERNNGSKTRELDSQLKSILRRNAGLMTQIRMQCAAEDAQPDGYMGINFEGITINRRSDGPTMYALGDGARIVSVEPGSPAQRAGLDAADQVLSIAGNDTRKPFPLGTLLRPGAKLSLRVSRDGRQRDLTVVVQKRPEEYGSPCSGLDDMVGIFSNSPQTLRRSEGPMTGSLQRMPNPDGAMPTSAGSGFALMTPYPASGAPMMVSGAMFIVLTPDWRETLGVEKGLLVSHVAMGSPAHAAGLKASDVVLSVGDSPVASPRALWSAVNEAGKDGVTLKVLRARKEITIVLKPAERR